MTDDHLSRISTQWSLVLEAHQGASDSARQAQKELLIRYFGAIYRYVRAAVHDIHGAEEICQEFAVRFVRGDLHRANPNKGRFRDYVKTAIYHLIVDHHRSRAKLEAPLLTGSAYQPVVPETREGDFDQHWREELLERAWQALRKSQATGTPYYEALRCRSLNPQADFTELTQLLSREIEQPLSEANVRQWVHRAREKFADLLLDEIGQSIQSEDQEAIEKELIELGLQPYCRSALKRRAAQ